MNKKNGKAIGVVLLVAAVVMFTYACRADFSPYKKEIAKTGSYVESVEADALIVRDETIVEKGTTGVLKSFVAQDERVKAYAAIGAVLSGSADSQKIAELNEMNREIEILTRALGENSLLSLDESKIDSTLDTVIENLRYSAAKNDLSTAVGLCDSVRVLTQRKAGVSQSGETSGELEALTARRDALMQSLGGSYKAIYAPVAGLYSSDMDGLEGVLTPQTITEMTPEQIDKYLDKDVTYNPEGLCKIINNYKWYIVFHLAEEECSELQNGKSYSVMFTDLGEAEKVGIVKSIGEKDSQGRCAVTMQFDEHIDNFTTTRRTRVQVIKEKYSGIYIPRSAIRVDSETQVQGVWVQNEVELEFRSIAEVYRDDDFVLVKAGADGQGGHKNIALYDNIVINPDK